MIDSAGLIGTASPAFAAEPSATATVDGIDYPVCSEEDCSDQPGQIGLWLDGDTGTWWLSHGETSIRVQS